MGTVNAFVEQERARAVAWKLSTGTLPDDARRPAPYHRKDGSVVGSYEFCLPLEYADFSLLPEVREKALYLFAMLGIPWHAGVGAGPSNHLLSSQVQCVNALTLAVHESDRLHRALGAHLKIGEVIPIEEDRYLTFEYIGEVDYFGEATRGRRTRGANCTSVDAAFLHRFHGLTELVLLEWKYTESYRSRRIDPRKDQTRYDRYWTSLADVDSPVRSDLLAFTDLLDEPLYQLMRQQLLAWHLETSHAHGADRVRVVHVCPAGNEEYQQSLHRPTQRQLGTTVSEAWTRLLRHPDRFLSVDSALFCDPSITSPEYCRRYGSTSAIDG